MKSHLKSRQKERKSVSAQASSPSSTKESKQLAVSVAILEIIEHDGLMGVTHSKIARKAKVSRAWIYEYIGKDKNELIKFGSDVFAGHLARVNITDLPKTKEVLKNQFSEGVQFLFDSIEKNPLIIKLYFRFRGTNNPVGQVISKYEKKWLEAAAKTISHVLSLKNDQALLLAESVLTLRLGFAHRIATSLDGAATRQRAEKVFEFLANS